MSKLFALPLVLIACSPAAAPDDGAPAAASESDLASAPALAGVREALFATDHDVWFRCSAGSSNHAVTVWVTTDDGSSENDVFARYSKASYEGAYVDSVVALGKAKLASAADLRYVFTFAIGKASATLDVGDGSTAPSLTVGTSALPLHCDSYDAPYTLDMGH